MSGKRISSVLAVVAIAGLWMAAVLPAQTPPEASPDLVSALAKEIGGTPEQAEGAAGALFSLAKTRLQAEDWSKVAGAVPGMEGLLKAAPAVTSGADAGGLGNALAAEVPAAADLGGLASVAGAFKKLGLQPEMVMKAIPILTEHVSKSGG